MADEVQYHVTTPEGKTEVIGNSQLQQALIGEKWPVIGSSADGQNLTFQDQKGKPYDVQAKDILADRGYQVHKEEPVNPNYDYVNPEWRAAVVSSQDDDHAKAYLESRLAKSPLAVPKVIGSGEDWYHFDPGTSKWYGLTRNPNTTFDQADAAGMAAKALPAGGALLGGALGAGGGAAAGGVGAIPGGMVGAVAGGAVGRSAQHGLMGALDPTYDVMNPTPEGMTSEEGMAMGGDAAAQGIGGALGKVASGPISAMARGGGKALEAIGSGVEKAAGFVKNNPIARWLAEEGGPLSDVANPALAAQLPRDVASGAMKIGRMASDKMGADSPAWLDELTQAGPDSEAPITEQFANYVAGKDTPPMRPSPSVDLGRNAGRMMGRKVGGMFNSPDGEEAAVNALKQRLAENPEFSGHSPEAMDQVMDTMRGGLRDASRAGAEETANQWGEAGAGLGRGVDALGGAGDAVSNAVSRATGAGLSAAGAMGTGMKYAGMGLNGAGNVGQSMELPAYARSLDDYLKQQYLQSKK